MDKRAVGWQLRTVLFLISQCITLFGSTLVQMAIVWYVTLKTSSGIWVAAFTVCSYLPQFLISFPSGVWADRYRKKGLIIGADAAIAAVTLVMLLLMPLITEDSLLLSGLLVLSVLRSCGAGVQTPAVNAVIPQMVPEDQLMRFNGINATMQSVVQFVAPAAAGALLTVSSLRASLLVDLVTAALGIGLLAGVAIPGQSKNRGQKVSAIRDMKAGIRYAVTQNSIGRVLAAYGLFVFLSVPAGFLAQLYVSRTYGDTYWYLTAVEVVGFAGMMLGGLVMSTWGGFKSRMATMRAGLVSFGLLAAGMGIAKSFLLYLLLMILYGVALTMVQTAVTTYIQEKAESVMQGRVFGLMGSMYAGFLPLGMVLFGPIADMIPLSWMMVGSGAGLILVSLLVKGHTMNQ